jgi:protein-tyrosine phosphatase
LGGVIDLRQEHQVRRSAPFIDEQRTHHVPLVDQVINIDSPPSLETPEDLGALYLDMYERGRDQLVKAVQLIVDSPDVPWLVHCAAGKDRTGVLVAALKVAVGVGADDIVTEYALSNGPVVRRRASMVANPLPDDPDLSQSPQFLWTAPSGAMATFLQLVAGRYGGLEEWPASMGFSAAAVAGLRDAWLT